MPSDLPWSLGGDEWNLLFLEHHSFALDRGWECKKKTVHWFQAKQINKIHYLVGRSKFWEGKINIFWQIDQQGFLFRLKCFDSFTTLSQCSLKIEGERNCSANGGHLASVTSQRTQDYLVARNSTVWIGGHLIYGVIFNLNPMSSINWAQTFQELMLITRVCGYMGPW